MVLHALKKDAGGSLINRFFQFGKSTNGTSAFFSLNHLGSIVSVTDGSGVIQSEYAYSPFGTQTKTIELVPAAFGFAGYYRHARSSLWLTMTRPFESEIGRFLDRDLLGEGGGLNQYQLIS